jgi:hypothetical protein
VFWSTKTAVAVGGAEGSGTIFSLNCGIVSGNRSRVGRQLQSCKGIFGFGSDLEISRNCRRRRRRTIFTVKCMCVCTLSC